MVDTLEKFEQGVVNVQSEEGKEFILFKRQLYQMYEVQNRSIDEHSAFSLGVERKNLKWLYRANMDFVNEMKRVNHLDNLVEHGALKGSVFKAKMLSPRRLQGLTALAATCFGYSNFSCLGFYFGPNVATLGLVAAAYYGMMQFYETQTISQIDYITDGENAGKLRVKVQKSPLSSSWVTVHPKNAKSVVSLSGDDMGETDLDSNIVYLEDYLDESTGTVSSGAFSLPADAYRDVTSLEWLLAPKEATSSLTDSFNHLMMRRHFQLASTGGLTGFTALTAQQTGYSNVNTENEIDLQLSENPEKTEKLLSAMRSSYGSEAL